MRQPGDVLWMLTKSNSSFIRSPKGSKSRQNTFSADPLNLTNFHNASASGSTQEQGFGLTLTRGASKAGKSFRREYNILIAHKSHHKTSRALKNSAAGNSYSTQTVRRGTVHTAKTIQGLTFVSPAKRALLLRRLGRLHAASGDHARGKK